MDEKQLIAKELEESVVTHLSTLSFAGTTGQRAFEFLTSDGVNVVIIFKMHVSMDKKTLFLVFQEVSAITLSEDIEHCAPKRIISDVCALLLLNMDQLGLYEKVVIEMQCAGSLNESWFQRLLQKGWLMKPYSEDSLHLTLDVVKTWDRYPAYLAVI